VSRRGPEELLAALPRTLGRRPITAETILLGWNDENRSHAVAVALAPDLWPLDHITAVSLVRDEGATRLAIVTYTGEPHPTNPDLSAWLRWMVAAAVRYDLTVHDALIVSRTPRGSAWRSLDCTDPSCCPQAGNPFTEEPSTP
jgi:hypothetical protein